MKEKESYVDVIT